MTDNRRCQRFPVESKVDVYFEQKGIWETQGVNLSETGILFKSKTPLGLYARAVLRLHLPLKDTPFLDVDAASIRSEAQGEWYLTAMEFMELNAQDREVIVNFLKTA